jgi:O-antigen/teichoic acid export membrane protein
MRMIPALRFRIREIQWGRARELLAFGGWSLLGYITYRVRETTVLFLLNRFATLADVTIFTLGYLGRRQIDTWMDVMGSSLYPVVTGMHALGAKERIRSLYLRGGRITLWITLLVAMPAAVYAEPIIRLYVGNAFLEAAVVMVLTLASLPITGGAWMIWQVSNATGRIRAASLYVCVVQLLIIPLVFGAVHSLRWDASGVALVLFAVGVFPEFLVLWPLGLKLADATFSAWVRETLIPGLTPACLGSLVWSVLAVVVQPDRWTALGLCVLTGALCYLIVLFALCLEPRDREDLGVLKAKLLRLLRPGLGAPPAVPAPPTLGEKPTAYAVPVESPHA